MKTNYPNLKQVKSDKGNGLPELHIFVMNLKGWLRGIHHHCSEEQLQGYLNEFNYRNNRRNYMEGMLDDLIKIMIKNDPKRLNKTT